MELIVRILITLIMGSIGYGLLTSFGFRMEANYFFIGFSGGIAIDELRKYFLSRKKDNR